MPKYHKNTYTTGRQPLTGFFCRICQKTMFSKTAARLHNKAVHGIQGGIEPKN